MVFIFTAIVIKLNVLLIGEFFYRYPNMNSM